MKYNYNLAPTRKKVNCHSLTMSVETKINEKHKNHRKKKNHILFRCYFITEGLLQFSNKRLLNCVVSRPDQIYRFLSKCLLTSFHFISCIYKSLLVRLCGKISVCNVWRVITFMLSCFGCDLRLACSGDRDIILPLIEGIYSDYV